jgi:single-stranded-DNA-specific exonuclease
LTKWRLKPQVKVSDKVAENLSLPKPVIQLLYNRGITGDRAIKKFLNPSLDDLHDPMKMKSMKEAVVRIQKAIANNEKITILGDYDVDGITSTTIMLKIFKRLGYKNVNYYIPNRLKEGYGISIGAIDYLDMLGTNLIVTVDNGITAKKQVEYAKGLGIDVVISD